MKKTAYSYLKKASSTAYGSANAGQSGLYGKTPYDAACLRMASAVWDMIVSAYERRAPWLAVREEVIVLLTKAHDLAKEAGMKTEDPEVLMEHLAMDFKSAVGTDLFLRGEF